MSGLWPAALWSLSVVVAGSAGATEAVNEDVPSAFSFAVVADLPFGPSAEPAMADLLASIDASSASFTIELGNIKGHDEPCSDTLLETRKSLFEGIQKPLVVLPGANDWLACAQSADSTYDPQERLGRLRELFDPAHESLGQETLAVARQSGMRRFRDYAENVRWEYGRVMFVGLNVPSMNNDYRLAAGRNGEFEDRVIANHAWLERAFKIAESRHLPALVVAIEGDPEFQRPLRPPDRRLTRRDGYYEFKLQLRELAAHFRGEVLLVHAAANGTRGDEPLTDVQGRPLRNLVRVQSFGTPNLRRWVRIDVDTRRAHVFGVRFEEAVPAASLPASAAPGSGSGMPDESP
jgi:hypothetical protein